MVWFYLDIIWSGWDPWCVWVCVSRWWPRWIGCILGNTTPLPPPPGLNHTAMRDAQRNTTRTPTWHFQTAPLSPSQDRARCPIPHCGIGQRTIIYIQLNCFCHAHLYIHFYSLPKRRKGFFFALTTIISTIIFPNWKYAMKPIHHKSIQNKAYIWYPIGCFLRHNQYAIQLNF